MKSYRYSLEKYSGPDSKHICPKCGKKKFVRYVDNISGRYIREDIGKCDRLTNCGYHKSLREAGINTKPLHYPRLKPKEKKRASFIPINILKSTMGSYQQNSFVIGLLKRFDESRVSSLIERFYIGTISNDVVF